MGSICRLGLTGHQWTNGQESNLQVLITSLDQRHACSDRWKWGDLRVHPGWELSRVYVLRGFRALTAYPMLKAEESNLAQAPAEWGAFG